MLNYFSIFVKRWAIVIAIDLLFHNLEIIGAQYNSMCDLKTDDLVARALSEFSHGDFSTALQSMQQAIAVDPLVFSQYHVWMAHCAMLAAQWDVINRCLPANTNSLMTTGWLDSLWTGKPVNAVGEAVPWYAYPAIDFVQSKIQKDFRVFEWGCGNSTLFWAKRVAQVVSVESDILWFQTIRSQLPENARIAHAKNKPDYVNYIHRCNGPFDVIVIDGDYRNECAFEAPRQLTAGGFIIFDNSDRRAYEQGIEYLRDLNFLEIDFFGLAPSYFYKTCTTIFFKDAKLLLRGVLPIKHESCVGISMAQTMKE